MMKIQRILFLIILFFTLQKGYSQLTQADTTATYRSIIPVNKQNLLSNVDLIANMQFAHRTNWKDNDWQNSKFRMEQFRLEVRGFVRKNVYFRFRHRYTSGFEPQSIDKIIKGVDYAYLNFRLNPKWSLTLGKMGGNLGGMEFDLNPINVYQYSDLIDNLDNFLSGVAVRYEATNNHAFTFQLLNSRTKSFEEIFGDGIVGADKIEASKAPWASVLNWHGKLFEGKLITRWHYSLINDAKNEFQSNVTIGQQLNLGSWSFAYDFKLSLEDIDRSGIIRNLISTPGNRITLKDTKYSSHWLSIQHKLNSKWLLSLTAFVDLASVKDDFGNYQKVRNAYAYIPAIEYKPFDDLNVKFFVNYIGRNFRSSTYGQDIFNIDNVDTARISFGMSAPLKFL